jgi:hypothetical protein
MDRPPELDLFGLDSGHADQLRTGAELSATLRTFLIRVTVLVSSSLRRSLPPLRTQPPVATTAVVQKMQTCSGLVNYSSRL